MVDYRQRHYYCQISRGLTFPRVEKGEGNCFLDDWVYLAVIQSMVSLVGKEEDRLIAVQRISIWDWAHCPKTRGIPKQRDLIQDVDCSQSLLIFNFYCYVFAM